MFSCLFIFNDSSTTEIYTLSLTTLFRSSAPAKEGRAHRNSAAGGRRPARSGRIPLCGTRSEEHTSDSSHSQISYAVFCLKKKTPNLGGFFMFRSYYTSECHADYFDFERIEALKPAIEACGISTLSQSPMLGFHKQMDNRIKLLEEILSFRMQGVEFDNGDMYVDGHKAASDVRDEFVSVTE